MCQRLMTEHKITPVLESLPDDYDSVQLAALSESQRTLTILTEEEES